MIALTSMQMALARHALGLPNENSKSYRNRYFVTKRHATYKEWMNLREQGLAELDEVKGSGLKMFYLTRLGAECVLEDGETLCPEDFPPTTKPEGE